MNNIKKQPLRRKGSQHAPPEQRLEQLLQAAIKCFGEKGYYGTKMDDIAKESGLSKGTLYRFFTSKDDLLMTILDHWDEWVKERLEKYPKAKTPLEELKLFCLASVTQMNEHKALINVWLEFFISDKAKDKVRQSHETERQMIVGIISQGMESGLYKKLPPVAVANTLIALLEGVIAIAAVDPEFDMKERFEEMWDVFVQCFTE